MKHISRTPKAIQNAQKRATRGERHQENSNLRALLKNASWEGIVRYEIGNERTKVRIPTRSAF